MKTLVTHINPHLDDIASIWLFKKFHPEFGDANVEFISASRDAAKDESDERIYLGTGGGQFDEHKEGSKTCAASLVYEFLKEAGLMPEDDISQKAMDRLIEWNLLVDTGKAPNSEFDEFSVQSFIRTKDSKEESSQKSVELGMEILSRILVVLKRKQKSIKDWESKIEFESQFGKSYAVISDNVDREFCREQGGDLFLIYGQKHNSVQFFTPSFEIDLESLYQKLKEKDSEAAWFLHQSHHMVLCGSASAPDAKPCKLSYEELIEIAKGI